LWELSGWVGECLRACVRACERGVRGVRGVRAQLCASSAGSLTDLQQIRRVVLVAAALLESHLYSDRGGATVAAAARITRRPAARLSLACRGSVPCGGGGQPYNRGGGARRVSGRPPSLALGTLSASRGGCRQRRPRSYLHGSVRVPQLHQVSLRLSVVLQLPTTTRSNAESRRSCEATRQRGAKTQYRRGRGGSAPR
jgi:hypothetical protein